MRPILIACIYVMAPFVIIYLYRHYKFFSKIGTVLVAYAIGIIMSLTGLMEAPEGQAPMIASIQEWFMNLAVPLAIPLMLFSSDFKSWFKTLNKTMATLGAGLLSVMLTIVLAYFLFRNAGISDLWKISGMLVGMYTGGTLNFAALSRILEVDSSTYVMVQTFDTVLGFVLLLFIIGGGYKFFRRFLPGAKTASPQNKTAASAQSQTTPSAQTDDTLLFENYGGMLAKGNRGRLLQGFALSVVCLAAGAGLSTLLGAGLNEMIIILTITTLAIILSFNQHIRSLPHTFELGMFFILMFSVIIASQFNLGSLISRQSLNILAMVGFVLVVSVAIHLLLAKLFKVEGDLFTVSHVALLFSPPFVPPVAAAMKNRNVLVPGIIIGLIGYAAGTYLGTLLAELFKFIG